MKKLALGLLMIPALAQAEMAMYIKEVDPSYWSKCDFEFARAIEAKIKEKNT